MVARKQVTTGNEEKERKMALAVAVLRTNHVSCLFLGLCRDGGRQVLVACSLMSGGGDEAAAVPANRGTHGRTHLVA